jgi:hypothetical protein
VIYDAFLYFIESHFGSEFRAKKLQNKISAKFFVNKVHVKTRQGMMIKYFSDRISPAVHDSAAKKEGFGVWKEQWMHERYFKTFKKRDDPKLRTGIRY